MTGVSSPTAALPVAAQVPSDREKLHKAAQAFEALLVKQVLTSARAANFGNDLLTGQGAETFNAMQDERFAQIAAERGSLGFAKVIEAQLAKRVGGATSFDKLRMSGSGRLGLSTSPAQAELVEARAQLLPKGS